MPTPETSPHDYEPGERTDEMQTDPDCWCGQRHNARVHNGGSGLEGWQHREHRNPLPVEGPTHVPTAQEVLRLAGQHQAARRRNT